MGNKPKMRFKGFTDDWEQRKFGEIFDSFEYGLNAAAKEYDGENKYIRITDIDDSSHDFLKDDITSPDTDLANAENFRLKYGDILFARTGASVGKTYIYKESDGLMYYAGFLIRGRVKNGFSPEFIFQSTLTDAYNKFIRITSQRSGQPGVNAQEYASYEFFVPKCEEQKKIGDYFRALDHLITLQQRKCDGIKNVKKSMLEKMFPQNEKKVPELRFKEFTDDWEQRKVGELGEVITGSTPSTSHAEYYSDDGIPWVTPTDINGNVTCDTPKKLSEEGQKVGRVVPKDTILVTCIASIGKNTMLGKMGSFNQQINGLVPDFERYSPYFLFTESELWSRKMKREAAAGTMQIVNKTEFSNIETLVPELKEQQKIGDYFKSLDHLITLHQTKLELLQNIKKSCLEKMFA